MDRVEIRRLEPGDWEVFRDLRVAALSDAPHAFGSTLDGEQRLGEADWRAKLASRAQFVAGDAARDAARDDTPIGTVGAYREGDVMELISMWVDPRRRGHGIATALVDRVIVHARSLGCSEVRLWVAEGNTVAERLYRRCGFAWTGAVQRIRPDEPRSEAEMVRVL